MDSDLLDIVDRLGEHRVMIVGDFMLDEYVFGPAERISPEAPVPVLRTQRSEFRLGGAGSVAVMVTALGGRVDCVGVIGSDRHGDRLLDMLRAAGADTDGLVRVADRPTTHKLRIVGLAQLRHPQQLVRLDTEDARPVDGELERRLLGVVRERLAGADVVCLQDYAKGVLTPTLCREVIAAAKEKGRKVLVDPARIPDYSKYAGSSCLTPNRTEAMLATGLPDMDGSNAALAARRLLERLGCEAMSITLDKDGAFLAEAGGAARLIPTRPRVVYDNAGAGDMVLATMAMALAAGAGWEQTVRLANVGGGLEVERFGVQPIPLAELRAALVGHADRAAHKIRAVEALVPEIARRRTLGERIVFTNGCFDLLHPGHVEYLAAARHLGDCLVVGLNSDASVRGLGKGGDRPIYGQRERAAMLAALEAVDFVTVFEGPTPRELISAVQPDVLVKGEDYRGKEVVGREIVEARPGGRVVLLPLKAGYSTTALVERLRGTSAR
jgi:D-beta-D-heptose 7-phosphate kinase/D-beta-D-heptose 1-phosphate adenosyltransferase